MNQPFYWRNNFLTRLILLSTILISFSCQSTTDKEKSNLSSEPQMADFPNVLNLKGIPDSATDRSVFAFSDMGAWFGFALPDVSKKDLLGSFPGPFLMTQDNGVWIGPVLSKLEIVDMEKGQLIDLAGAEVEGINSYPGKLKQVFRTKVPDLLITADLIFASSRTSLTRVNIENKGNSADLKLQVRWSGTSFSEGVSFLRNEAGIQIGFSKNEHLGLISTDLGTNVEVAVQNGTYEIRTPEKLLAANDSWEIALAHSFCFSTEELTKEKFQLKEILTNPKLQFSKNEERWNHLLSKTLSGLDSNFNTKSYQQIAMKCLQTLTTNWRSSAGFLKHEGLFPSYNYEWFHGFWAWDSWKHTVALAHFDVKLAQNQIRAMYDFQDSMGMIADCAYRDTVIEVHNWRDTKPPLSAWAIWNVFEQSKDEDFLKELFPKVAKYHQWWYQYRDHDQNGLCEYGSTDGTLIAAKWESGMDNAVRFDDTKIAQNNEFGWSMNRESVDLNAYLFAEKQYLAKIAEVIGEKEKATQYAVESTILKNSIQTIFYDEVTGWFYDIDLETKKHLKVFGAEGWIPLWAGAATTTQAAKVRETMIDTTKFATYIPFPTLSADHPKFKPNGGYWRGPVWLDQAYFAIKGLSNYGYNEDAMRFSNQLFDRLEGLKDTDAPIWENYHPLTGEGLESRHFSWSAAHLLMLLKKE